MTKRFAVVALTLFILSYPFCSQATVRLPSILGSHMVLQQNSTSSFWGWANPGEAIRIITTWDTVVYRTVTDAGGHWRIPVQTPAAGGPYRIIINGSNALILEDVMLGEVWICSGQSNMEWSGDQGLPQSLEEAPRANNNKIRFFYIPKTTSATPQDNCEGSWKVCSPEEMVHFSAIGYFFGKNLQQELRVPVGLINSNWGGTPAEVWTPAPIIEQDAELKNAAARLNPSSWWPIAPGATYNAMIYPLSSFAIAGCIWYQGESNTGTAATYSKLFSAMIHSWRKTWQKEFPFYYVQIAPFRYGNQNIGALLREAQTQTLSVPHTGMVVVSDLVNDTNNIHPTNKIDVARRLSNLALTESYGKKGLPAYSPQYESMEIEKDKIRIRFSHAENGLISKNGPPTGFCIAGADRHFVPASARIEGNTVVVWSKIIDHPVAVRFAFSNTEISNLFGADQLPVNLFRTDHWEVETPPVQ